MDREKLLKLMGASKAEQTGGKGTMRRKKKAVHKTTTTDDKRLQNTLKRLGVNTIPGIEEVNIFKDDTAIHFVNPKVQASIAANTFVISGPSTTKKVQELMPGILNQMGPDSLSNLKKMMSQPGCHSRPVPEMLPRRPSENGQQRAPVSLATAPSTAPLPTIAWPCRSAEPQLGNMPGGMPANAASMLASMGQYPGAAEGDDDVPDLVSNFEEASK
ncbi:MAG: hypothetical protein WDW36_004714 [Sanguina aurantia]